jgi:ankyrin repeat protein
MNTTAFPGRLVTLFLIMLVLSIPGFCGEIHDAARAGDLAKVKALLKTNPDLISNRDQFGRMPLHWAAWDGQQDVAELLLAKGADVNVKDKDNLTPMHAAAAGGHKSVAELLLVHGAEVDAKANRCPLVSWDAVNQSLTIKDATPLHWAAYKAHKDVAELLLTNKADVNGKDSIGDTPLHWAASGGHKGVAELLLDNKASVNAQDKDNSTPLHKAASGGHKDVAELLLARGAEVDAKAIHGPWSMPRQGSLSPEFLQNWDATPLHFAVQHDHKDVAALLLAHGADANSKDNRGITPLHLAVWKGKDMVELLLSYKGEVNVKDFDGKTLLFWAAINNRKDVAEFLIAHGAEVNAKDNMGRTPMQSALRMGPGFSKETVEVLRRHGGE